MASYVIGDVQGCFKTLERLARQIGFDATTDRLWLVGDLVNRGPRSLEVLRWARDLGDRLTVVLGNHDLHLLALAEGVREPRSSDTLKRALRAPDAPELLDWLAERPLLHREGGFVLVHAGLHPAWSLDQAAALAREAEGALRLRRHEFLDRLYRGRGPSLWSDALAKKARLRMVIDVLTRMRTVTTKGEICAEFSGPPAEAPAGCRPWFELASIPASSTVLFGHWSRLGLVVTERFIGVDSGCVWGGALTAVRLEDRRVFQEPLSD